MIDNCQNLQPDNPKNKTIEILYKLEHVQKTFVSGTEQITVLKDINLTIHKGERIAILGSSGCGKSTLLHLMGTLDTPTRGKVFFTNKNLHTLSEKDKAVFRNQKLGFVFQFHHLLPELNVLENVALPGIIQGMKRKHVFSLAQEALTLVGMEHKLNASIPVLSGGEKQRVAIARAILLRPEVILGDEPTGNLDEENGEKIGKLLCTLNQEIGTTLIIVTHNLALANLMQKKYFLRTGHLYEN
ncbi:MAG: ABC transporter ATP-binding protein [Desulfonauticus sp.]|nr:ABC transporter ATP-binding protein [Desulfonauticus sp.]